MGNMLIELMGIFVEIKNDYISDFQVKILHFLSMTRKRI